MEIDRHSGQRVQGRHPAHGGAGRGGRSQKIEKYATLAIDYDKLDCYSSESFVKSLMREVGNYQVKSNEEKEPIINESETISGKLDLSSLVGRTIECKVENDRKEILKMRRVKL